MPSSFWTAFWFLAPGLPRRLFGQCHPVVHLPAQPRLAWQFLLFHTNPHIMHCMQEQQSSSSWRRLTKWLVPIGALIVLSVWIYIAPPGLMGKLDAVGYAVCHRLDSHSLHVGGIQLPLCARCTGEFNAAAIGLVFQGLIGHRKSRLPNRGILAVLVLFFLAFAVDGSNSYLALLKNTYAGAFSNIPNLYVTDNTTRVFTG